MKWYHVVNTILVVAAVTFGLFFLHKAMVASQYNQDFGTVCTYQGGRTEGDVCVKDNKIILTQDQYEERVK